MSIKDLFRDKTRDIFHKKLREINVDCSLSKRGVDQEKLFNPWHRASLGIITINTKSPIKYINIIKHFGGKNDPKRWWFYFAVPSKTSQHKEDYIEVKSLRKKSFPVIGNVKSIYWKSNKNGKILADKFKQDIDINSLSKKLGNLKVQSLHENFALIIAEKQQDKFLFIPVAFLIPLVLCLVSHICITHHPDENESLPP